MTKWNELAERACKTAAEHGFHNGRTDTPFYFMMTVTELSEAINADRKNNHASPIPPSGTMPFKEAFERYVKDSVEDELADACIWLLDLAGMRDMDVTPVPVADVPADITDMAFTATRILTSHLDTGLIVNYTIGLIAAYAMKNGIPLMYHINHKMEYNDTRPYTNEKMY